MQLDGKGFEAGEILNDEPFCSSDNDTFSFQATHNARCGFNSQASHVRQIATGQTNIQTKTIGLCDPSSGDNVDKQRGNPLVGPIQSKGLGLLLSLAEAMGKVGNHFKAGFGVPPQHIQVGFLVDAQDFRIVQHFGTPWVAPSIKDGSFAAKEITRHQDFQGDIPTIWRRFDAFDRSFFEDVEPLCRVALPKNVLILAMRRFKGLAGQFFPVSIGQKIEKGKIFEGTGVGHGERFTAIFSPFRRSCESRRHIAQGVRQVCRCEEFRVPQVYEPASLRSPGH